MIRNPWIKVMGLCLLALAVDFSVARTPGFRGSIEFSSEERARHREGLWFLLWTAARCLDDDLERHASFYSTHGVSPFYGDRSSFAKLSYPEKRALLAALGKDPSLVDQMEPTSCVGLTRKCLSRGFTAVGQSDLWQRIDAYTLKNDVDGTAMQDALQKLGWRILFWNPDVSQNQAWDEIERAKDPTNEKRFWGYHAYRWATVRRPDRKYYFNTVDDLSTLVNFGHEVPSSFRRVPFFVGTAHTGYHVFPGRYGLVIEAHSTRAITDPMTLEAADFDPLADDGAPAGAYRSGLMAVPPGY